MTSFPLRQAWRTIVVDDEPLARQALRLLLSPEEDFAIVAECTHGAEAIDAIRRERPDVLLLDVQMPEVDGFEVLRQLEPCTVPAVIFVTAFDRYALQAFEQHALDYLLKPFSNERFAVVLERTRARLRGRTLLVRDSLRALERSLDRSAFVRVHRSAIANVTCIREIKPVAWGDQRLTLSDGTVLKVSRTYREQVVNAV